ncbi:MULTISPECIES: hypothetical protein [Afipia]|uniref:hypothetical protein n=1 Tax=Afipia TaxID=1033 RepID=UPI001FCEE04A|nr:MULTISPECIES: hypothetical protein [Afipia]
MSTSAYAAESLYTRTSGPECRDSGSKEEFNAWQCPGPGGYSAGFSDEGNLVAFKIFRTGQRDDEPVLIWRGADDVFGDKLEWRLSGGKPIAAILRAWRVDTDQDGHDHVTQELLVVSLRGQRPCKVGAVSVHEPHANRRARALADSIAPCQADGK